MRMRGTRDRRAKPFATVLVGLVLSVVAAGPAFAESVVVTDHRRDVWHVDQTEDGSVLGYRKIGRAINVNIADVTLRHRPGTVLTRTRFLDLRVPREGLYYLNQRIRTGAREYRLNLRFDPSLPAGYVGLYNHTDSEVVDCEGLDLVFDYRAETVTTIIPRECLDTPVTVRTNVHAWGRWGGDDHNYDVFDRPGHGKGGWTRALKAGSVA